MNEVTILMKDLIEAGKALIEVEKAPIEAVRAPIVAEKDLIAAVKVPIEAERVHTEVGKFLTEVGKGPIEAMKALIVLVIPIVAEKGHIEVGRDHIEVEKDHIAEVAHIRGHMQVGKILFKETIDLSEMAHGLVDKMMTGLITQMKDPIETVIDHMIVGKRVLTEVGKDLIVAERDHTEVVKVLIEAGKVPIEVVIPIGLTRDPIEVKTLDLSLIPGDLLDLKMAGQINNTMIHLFPIDQE